MGKPELRVHVATGVTVELSVQPETPEIPVPREVWVVMVELAPPEVLAASVLRATKEMMENPEPLEN